MAYSKLQILDFQQAYKLITWEVGFLILTICYTIKLQSKGLCY